MQASVRTGAVIQGQDAPPLTGAVIQGPDAPPLTIARLAATSGLPRREAMLLAGHALGAGAAWVIAHDGDPLSEAQAECVATALRARCEGHPVAYITGVREFYGLAFRVCPDVLIPRPETELLVDLAREMIERGVTGGGAQERARVVDLGTGSGAVAVALAAHCPRAEVWAVDCSAAALAVARENAARHGGRVQFVESNWFSALGSRTFDFAVGNPPYVACGDDHLQKGDLRFEPRAALCAGEDGLAGIGAIIDAAPGHLSPEGWLLLEHGFDQAAAVRDRLAAARWREIATWRDLSGLERVSGGRRPCTAERGPANQR
jgi:release factor glutamine methyltransferase